MSKDTFVQTSTVGEFSRDEFKKFLKLTRKRKRKIVKGVKVYSTKADNRYVRIEESI